MNKPFILFLKKLTIFFLTCFSDGCGLNSAIEGFNISSNNPDENYLFTNYFGDFFQAFISDKSVVSNFTWRVSFYSTSYIFEFNKTKDSSKKTVAWSAVRTKLGFFEVENEIFENKTYMSSHLKIFKQIDASAVIKVKFSIEVGRLTKICTINNIKFACKLLNL